MKKITIGLVALMALGACSTKGETTSTPAPTVTVTETATETATVTATPSPADTTGLETAVRQYSDFFLKGNHEAEQMLSKRCKPIIGSQVNFEIAASDFAYEAIATFTVGKVEGNTALVTYKYADGAYNQDGQPWVYEDGNWRYDAC